MMARGGPSPPIRRRMYRVEAVLSIAGIVDGDARKSMRACAACACFAFVATPTAKIDTRWTSSGSGPT